MLDYFTVIMDNIEVNTVEKKKVQRGKSNVAYYVGLSYALTTHDLKRLHETEGFQQLGGTAFWVIDVGKSVSRSYG